MALGSAASRLALGVALLFLSLATGCANDFDGLFKATAGDGGDSADSGGAGATVKDVCVTTSCSMACPPDTPCLLSCTQEHPTKCEITGCTTTKCKGVGESTVLVCNGAPCPPTDAGAGD